MIKIRRITAFIGMLLLSYFMIIPAYAAKPAENDLQQQAKERYEMPAQTNEIANWPTGPQVYADSAIVMDADTGTILYAKNIYEAEYPASTTKILTGLLAQENCSMDEVVEFSSYAVNIPWDASKANMKAGDSLYMEQAMYALMVGSANEVATAIGEHIAGSEEAFSQMMNNRAKELGCVNTNFVNANGLFSEEHYTCAYDLALIAREYFSYELLSRMSNTYHYFIDASDMQPEDKDIYSHNKLLAGQKYAYDKLVGSKTGYTDVARSTLVTCAESGGLKLICVVLKEESPNQFEDTISLLEYGFRNFKSVYVSDVEKKYSIENTDSFYSEKDLFGNSEPLLYLDPDAKIIIPATVEFDDLDCELVYDTSEDDKIGTLNYSYHEQPLGTSYIKITGQSISPMKFQSVNGNDGALLSEMVVESDADNPVETQKVIYINVKQLIVVIIIGAILLVGLIYIITYLRSYQFASKRRDKKRRKRAKRTHNYMTVQRRDKGTQIRHRKQKRWKRWK
ncbi:MAG: D-alanyl-D-alanine carboxypeptidase [Lachnospiraceae bacterium]|nr:D-alanyl-D-alanine carboxypeptidase [Candidatus Merdinaster equi]